MSGWWRCARHGREASLAGFQVKDKSLDTGASALQNAGLLCPVSCALPARNALSGPTV